MAASLKDVGFELIGGRAHLNQTADQMKQLIREFGEKLSNGGVGLFYYAGHGVQAQGRNFLIPIDANILREKTLEFDAVDVNRILAEMDAAGNGFNILILDACRNNPFTRSWRSSDQGLAQINAPEGTLIAYATSPGKVAGDGTGRNGTYTGQLLQQIHTPRPIEEVFKAVRASVKSVTNNQQTPWESSSLVGEFCFIGSCSNTANIPPANDSSFSKSNVDPTAIELSYWDAIKTSTDPEDFKSYLEKYPNGQFADIARRRAKTTPQTQPVKSSDSPTFFEVSARVHADASTNGWTNTGLVVRYGQRLKISASGVISLGRGLSSAPEGSTNLIDLRKLMPSYPTGALIAVIGDNNDDFVFIGRGREFLAPHDGVLFLGVNEGNLTDNAGAYDVVIQAETLSRNNN